MKKFLSGLPAIITGFFLITLFMVSAASAQDIVRPLEWGHVYGTGWQADAIQHRRYAQAMGYRYVGHLHQSGKGDVSPEGVYMTDSERTDYFKENLYFYFIDPYKSIQPEVPANTIDAKTLRELVAKYPYEFRNYPELPRVYDGRVWNKIKQSYPKIFEAYKNMWEEHFMWYDLNAEFPLNMAQAAITGKGTNENFIPNCMYQKEIDFWVNTIVRHIKNKSEKPELNYRCAGIWIDLIEKYDEMGRGKAPRPGMRPASPDGKVFVKENRGKFDYADPIAGWNRFLYDLKMTMTRELGREMHFLYEPWEAPNNPHVNIFTRWTDPMLAETGSGLTSEQKKEIKGDIVFNEAPTYRFINDKRYIESGLYKPYNLGVDSPDLPVWDNNDAVAGESVSAYARQLEVMGPVAAYGSWFSFFGMNCRVGGDGYYRNIDINHYPPQIRLARIVSGWDNLTEAGNRSWNQAASLYKSDNSYADRSVICSRRPDNGKIYVTFVKRDGKIQLSPGEKVLEIKKVNSFMEPDVNGAEDLDINGNTVSINWDSAYPLRCYILTTNRSGTVIPCFSVKK